MSAYPIWDPFERVLWGFAFITAIIGGLLYLKKSRERDDPGERIIFIGFAGLLFLAGIAIIFFFLNELFVSGTYRDLVFYGEHDISLPTYEILFKVGWSFYYASLAFFTFTFEMNDKRTKFILTTISIVNLLIFILVPLQLIRAFSLDVYVFSYSAMIFWIIIYIYSKRSDMEFKVISSYLLLYGTFVAWGFTLTINEIKENDLFPLFLAPLFIWLGMLCVIAPLLIKPINLRNSLVVWQFLMALNIIIFLIMILLVYQNFETYQIKYSMTPSLFLITSIFIEFSNLKSLLSYYRSDDAKNKEEQQSSLFSMFSRPQKLTEEEVSISKEKKICLVCKGKVIGITFICRGCESFYCKKCYKALTELENQCWACDNVLDESKPVKLDKKEDLKELELEPEPQVHKGKKQKL